MQTVAVLTVIRYMNICQWKGHVWAQLGRTLRAIMALVYHRFPISIILQLWYAKSRKENNWAVVFKRGVPSTPHYVKFCKILKKYIQISHSLWAQYFKLFLYVATVDISRGLNWYLPHHLCQSFSHSTWKRSPFKFDYLLFADTPTVNEETRRACGLNINPRSNGLIYV